MSRWGIDRLRKLAQLRGDWWWSDVCSIALGEEPSVDTSEALGLRPPRKLPTREEALELLEVAS